jgi:dihydroorotate dehydrogenase electron transfer subunit
MSGKCSSSAKGLFDAAVVSNRRIGETFYRLKLEFSDDGAKVFSDFQPGQFAELDISNAALPSAEAISPDLRDASGRKILLRRPFSFAEVTAAGRKTFAELLYCVVGPATVRMTTLSAGDVISVIGPLGKGYRIAENKRTVLLVGGGMGTPPLQHLAQELTDRRPDVKVISFAGAKTKAGLPFEGRLDEISEQLGFSLPEFAKYGIESRVATDDGSAGYRGFVTDLLAEWLDKSGLSPQDTIICGCGPEPMLASLARVANDRNIDCQVSMERRMACGIGLCQSCAVDCRMEGSDETIYKMCCQDGPVFDAKDVVF